MTLPLTHSLRQVANHQGRLSDTSLMCRSGLRRLGSAQSGDECSFAGGSMARRIWEAIIGEMATDALLRCGGPASLANGVSRDAGSFGLAHTQGGYEGYSVFGSSVYINVEMKGRLR